MVDDQVYTSDVVDDQVYTSDVVDDQVYTSDGNYDRTSTSDDRRDRNLSLVLSDSNQPDCFLLLYNRAQNIECLKFHANGKGSVAAVLR